MSVKIADEYEYIKARMEEIKAERDNPAREQPTAANYIAPAVDPEPTTYMGWDIYAPYVPE